MVYRAVGGLTEVGVSEDEDLLLVVSHAGRGLIEIASGQRIARDDEAPTMDSDWINEPAKLVRGIGLAADLWFTSVGLWGGSLANTNLAGWFATIMTQGEDELALIREPESEKLWLVEKAITEIKAFGFTNSGELLVLATSGDVVVFANEA